MKCMFQRSKAESVTEARISDVLSKDGKTVEKREWFMRQARVINEGMNQGDAFVASFRYPYGAKDSGIPLDVLIPPGARFECFMTAYEEGNLHGVKTCVLDLSTVKVIK